jgi:hypothetical protein
LVAATGIASGVDSSKHHQGSNAIDPRVGDHGSRCGVPGLPACVHPTPCAAVVNRPPS